jgi:hypothetical protein
MGRHAKRTDRDVRIAVNGYTASNLRQGQRHVPRTVDQGPLARINAGTRDAG